MGGDTSPRGAWRGGVRSSIPQASKGDSPWSRECRTSRGGSRHSTPLPLLGVAGEPVPQETTWLSQVGRPRRSRGRAGSARRPRSQRARPAGVRGAPLAGRWRQGRQSGQSEQREAWCTHFCLVRGSGVHGFYLLPAQGQGPEGPSAESLAQVPPGLGVRGRARSQHSRVTGVSR